MKQILTISILLIFISCTKDRCYECETVITAKAPGIDPQISTLEFDFCGDKREVTGTTTSTVTVEGITATAKSKTTCKGI